MHINIGKLIKQEMIRQGLKPGELAERIWVTRTNI
jgi:plasmid maintenance system antidote protein VapI